MKFLLIVVNFVLGSAIYSRLDFGNWIDVDHDCQNTRQEILILESKTTPTMDIKNCVVISGFWNDSYTSEITTNPNDLDIDHIVPLKNTYINGAKQWNHSQKIQYFNDFDVLIAVSKNANRAKGDKDPSFWMPPNINFQCEYIRLWHAIKNKYNLTMTVKEFRFIQNFTLYC
jgi:hypothetical protein